jgi:hypothetical protein
MNPFYALNKTLDNIRNEPTQEQKALVESQAPKSPAKKTLEEALRTDLRSLMEDGTGGMSGSNTLEQNDSISEPEKMDILRHAMKGLPAVDSNRLWSIMIKELSNAYNNMPGGDEWSALKPLMSKFKINWDRFESLAQKHGYNSVSDLFNNIEKERSNSLDEAKDKSLSQAAKTVKKGALHKQEGIPKDKKIGDKKLNSLKKSGTPLEKKRANFALNIQGKGKKKVDENMDMEECTECMMGECGVHGINELSHGAVVKYRTNAQQDLRKLKQQPVDDFVSNMRQGHRVGDAANMAVQNNLKAIKKAKTRSSGLDRADARIGEEYASEGATPAELTQQTMLQNKRAAATRRNSRDVQRQPPQSGPHRSEIPAFIRKGRGDPALDHTDLEETNMYSESDKDILDYLKAKLVPNGGNARAKSVPYNGSANTPDAYNGMEFEDSGSRFDKHEVSPGRTQYTRKYDPDTGHSIGTDSGDSAPAASDGPRKRGRQAGTKFSGGYAARHDGSHVSKAKMDSRKKDMDEEDEYSRHTASKSPAGGTVYTRKYDPDTGHSIGTDSGDSSPASDGPRKRGRPAGSKSGSGNARHADSHISKAKMDSRKKDMDEGSATCPHCGHAMADEGREMDMEGVKGGMGHFVKAAKKVGGVAKVLANRDYDGDGKKETSKAEHAGVVDKAIKANKAKPAAKTADKPKAKPAKKTEEGKGDGNLANNAKPYDKVTQGDVVSGRLGKDEEGGKKKAKKEEKVDETTTGSVSIAPSKKSSSGSGVGKGIYDSWERKYANLLKEDVNVTTNSSKNDTGEEEEHITIDVSGDDVARIKEMLHNMGVSQGEESGHEHGGEEPCDSCGGVPCQCDEMDEMIAQPAPATGAAPAPGTTLAPGAAPMGNPLAAEENNMDEETSFKDAGATVGRIGGTIAGGLAGAASGLGIGSGPGAVAGGIMGGSAGSALGTAAGRWLDKKTGAPEETDEGMVEHQRMMELAGLGEASVTYSDNEPDYPSNQEYSNDEMQYSGGLNGNKSTGQATLPVVASQIHRLHSHVSEGQRMNDLYKAIQAIENKEV